MRVYELLCLVIYRWLQGYEMKTTISLILTFCNCAAVAIVHAQTPADQDDVIRVETDVTNLLLTATDKQHRFITTLRAEDIRVLEDGTPQQLFTFQRETERPLAIAFLIDVSASEERALPTEKAAARSFIENVIKSSKDQVAIIPFTGSAFLEQPLTRDVLSVYRALEHVEVALPNYLGSGRPLSGIPTGPGMKAPPNEGTTAIGDSKQDGVNRDALRALAEHTGGRAFFPKKDTDLKTAFAEIEQELRAQYLIAYSSSNKNRDGAFRQLRLEIVNPDLRKEDLKLRYRPGYFAKPLRTQNTKP